MTRKVKKVAVIGTGVIGTGWIIRLLAHGKKVSAYDPDKTQEGKILKEINRAKPFVLKLFKKNKININNFKFFSSLKLTVQDADFIQECAPENIMIKRSLIKKIEKYTKSNTIIASSSSGLLPSDIQKNCINFQRVLIGHPFNPVYILPLVEIVAGQKTNLKYIRQAERFYKSLSMIPLKLKKEIPGYLSDRLQEALWRESLHIINEGLASTEDLDKAIIHGPGLRWSLMGTFLTFHLAGGKQGMRHMLKQFGPALKLPWTKLRAPKLSKKLSKKIISGTKKQSKGKSVSAITNIRDDYLISLLKMRKKYERKIN
ncbi:MAG: 3-hydroxybutyryl-CoA dehydrogenase [Pelagibacteraceae bacterium]|nr:3-hydroxybutyryl-CoA dehydrogenase [Pelagibacteraceae bacterium]PPR51469.1 MAG: L-carnitine dehydrogenase [Alphaproteobacteria bacterium MarineAlpha5_Bin10]|tara:strand:+ start:897 stop:1841 length:945 start_codon:yes stop_codon:yes gene_type:complete